MIAQVRILQNPFHVYEALSRAILTAIPCLQIPDLFVAGWEELVEEVWPACDKAGVPFDAVMDSTARRARSWRPLLSEWELCRLDFYSRSWRERMGCDAVLDRTAVFNLGDDPWSHPTWSAQSLAPRCALVVAPALRV
jgi:hypothetical protein